MEHTQTVGAVPQDKPRHWTKILGALVATLAVLVITGFATGFVHVYDAPGNAGVVIGPNCSNLVIEWRGDPGVSTGVCE